MPRPHQHPIVSAVLVVIAGTLATWAHHVGNWLRKERYDPSRFNE